MVSCLKQVTDAAHTMKRLIPAFLAIGLMLMTGCLKENPVLTGLKDGKLQNCPDTFSCVSTQDPRDRYRMDPIPYTGSPEEARDKLLSVIRRMIQSTLVKAAPDYIHVEFRSSFFEFVDDVEFLFDDTAKLIHFRSASRKEFYDFKVNRTRMEDIRRRVMGFG